MTITNAQSGTNVHEIAPSIFRISTPVAAIPGGFTFNQILVVGRDANSSFRDPAHHGALSRTSPEVRPVENEGGGPERGTSALSRMISHSILPGVALLASCFRGARSSG